MVLMSMTVYKAQNARTDMYARIIEGRAQVDRGELIDGETVLNGLRSKYAK